MTKKLLVFSAVLLQFGCAQDIFYFNYDKKEPLQPVVVATRAQTNDNLQYYATKRGVIVGVGDKILVKLKQEAFLQNLQEDFEVKIIKSLGKNLYLVSLKDRSQTLDIANKIAQKEYVIYAHPDFVKKRLKR